MLKRYYYKYAPIIFTRSVEFISCFRDILNVLHCSSSMQRTIGDTIYNGDRKRQRDIWLNHCILNLSSILFAKCVCANFKQYIYIRLFYISYIKHMKYKCFVIHFIMLTCLYSPNRCTYYVTRIHIYRGFNRMRACYYCYEVCAMRYTQSWRWNECDWATHNVYACYNYTFLYKSWCKLITIRNDDRYR